MKIISTIFLVIAGCITTHKAQTNFQWADKMGGTQNDRAFDIAVDGSGNAYTTGSFYSTGDFDPGPGSYSLTSSGAQDIFISKVDASGNFVWAKCLGGAINDYGTSIKLDGSGNVIITGVFTGTVDFDPGAGVTNLISNGQTDAFILKLDANGNFVWAKSLGGSSYDEGLSVTADATGNIFGTGFFTGLADFDPGVGTFTMSSLSSQAACYVWKLDASGNFVWAKSFIKAGTGLPTIEGHAIALDGSGNVLIGGSFTQNTGGVDFDPGPGTFTLAAVNMDIFITKLDPSGNFVWVAHVNGAVGSNIANDITIDAANNVLATGYFQGTQDFDPGAGVFNLTPFGGIDIFVLKLNSSGNFVWAKSMGGNSGDQGKSISVSASGEVYTTGYYGLSGDFDPGPGVATLTCAGGTGVFISKLDASGNFVLVNGFGDGSSSGNGIVVTNWYDIYSTGHFNSVTDFDPNAGTFTLTPVGLGNDEIFIHKLGQSICPTFSVNSSTSSFTLMCAITSLTLNAVNTSTLGGVTYTWTAPSLSTSIGASHTATATGVYTISASAISNTCVVIQTLSVYQTTGNVNFNVSTTGATCNNNGSATVNVTSGTAPYTYTWSNGSNTTTAVGLAAGIHSLSVGDANQCVNTKTFSITNAAPAFTSAPICFVSVDTLSQYNVITWDKTVFPTADSFMVYRETAANVYSIIRRQPYSAFSQFKDTVQTLYFPNTGNPNIGTYRYKLRTKDNCGNYSTFSPYHNTIFIVNNNGTFTWSQQYIIEGSGNPVSSYILERDNLSNGNWAAVGSVAGTQNFIIDPNYGNYINTASWRVRTQWNIVCIPSKMMNPFLLNTSYSNKVSNNSIGMNELDVNNRFAVYPNPTSSKIVIQTVAPIEIKIYNALGDLIKSFISEKGDNLVDLQHFSNGIYFVRSGSFTSKIIKE